MEMNRQGLALSVEVYAPDGTMVGNSINFKIGNLVTGDTVYYDQKITSFIDDQGNERKLDPIDWSKVVDVVTFDYMNAMGISFMDVGMVSNYSKSLKGRLIPRAEYLELISQLPNERKEFSPEMDSFQYPDLHLQVKDLVKGAQSRALTQKGFLGGNALPTEHSIALAKEVGLVPSALEIFVVNSVEEAKAHAKANAGIWSVSGVSHPIYYIGQTSELRDQVEANGLATETLKKVVAEGARYIADPTDPQTKLLKPDTLRGIVNPYWGLNRSRWVNATAETGGPRIVIVGWALRP
jgi:hypothetical protein